MEKAAKSGLLHLDDTGQWTVESRSGQAPIPLATLLRSQGVQFNLADETMILWGSFQAGYGDYADLATRNKLVSLSDSNAYFMRREQAEAYSEALNQRNRDRPDRPGNVVAPRKLHFRDVDINPRFRRYVLFGLKKDPRFINHVYTPAQLGLKG